MKVDWNKEKENIKNLIESDTPYAQIGKIYGVSIATIKKVAKKLNIPLKQRRKINSKETFNKGKKFKIRKICLNCGNELERNDKYCNNKCQQEYQIKIKYEYYLSHQEEFFDKEISYDWLKHIFIKEQNHTCAICGLIDNWNGKELHFILDHIDGDAKNNKRENLRLICPNCDSQLDTFKARNKGRSTRKYKPFHIWEKS